MRYKKKPVVVEAIKFLAADNENDLIFEGDIPQWLLDALDKETISPIIPNICNGVICLEIKTLEGNHTALPGDFIIQGVKGELYPCKPDIFEQTYEEVGQC